MKETAAPKKRVSQNPNVLSSLRVAFNGLKILFTTQRNARIHAIAGCFLVISGFFIDLAATEWCILLLCIGMVISLEAVNTGIEITVNLVTREMHPLAGQAKDVAAAAVLLGVFFALACWGVICVPKYIAVLTNL